MKSIDNTMFFSKYFLLIIFPLIFITQSVYAESCDKKLSQSGKKEIIHALYIPLADHYAAIVAYEKYKDEMEYANFRIEQMPNWEELRAVFMSNKVDMAFVMAPLAMDMFNEDPMFCWIGLMHRDGNALAINDVLRAEVDLEEKRINRKPNKDIANAFLKAKKKNKRPVEIGVPALLATHTVILYKYLKDNNKTLGTGFGPDKDAVAIPVPPTKAPLFIKINNVHGIASAFEQSLPWADVVETQGFGYIAWYSKDVMPWPNGHVECIAIATNVSAINKKKALKEVNYYIHKAGQDIEKARNEGGEAILEITRLIRNHIPEHNEEAIVQSLRKDLNVINYRHLNIDKEGLKLIMDYAVEGKILKKTIDIDIFANPNFKTDITNQ